MDLGHSLKPGEIQTENRTKNRQSRTDGYFVGLGFFPSSVMKYRERENSAERTDRAGRLGLGYFVKSG